MGLNSIRLNVCLTHLCPWVDVNQIQGDLSHVYIWCVYSALISWIHVHTPCIYTCGYTSMHTPHTYSLWLVWPVTVIHVHTLCIYMHIYTPMHTPHTYSHWRVWPVTVLHVHTSYMYTHIYTSMHTPLTHSLDVYDLCTYMYIYIHIYIISHSFMYVLEDAFI